MARFVERAEAKVAAALDVDGREILPVRRVGEEIPEIVDDVNVEGRRRVGGEVAQDAVGAGIRAERRRLFEEHVLERLGRAELRPTL